MNTASIDREIRARIDSFLSELTDLVRQSALDAIHGALGTRAAPTAPRRGPGRPRKSGKPSPIADAAPKARRGKGGKRTPEAVLEAAAVVLAYIKAHEGRRLEQIGKGLGVPTKGLKLPITKLFEQKAIKTKGEKRGTKYFAR